jgi:C1A family cysteine protease
MTTRTYGWVRDLPSNDDNFLLVAHPSKKFPSKKFLGNLPPVYDQGQLGSCTANALAGAFQYEQRLQNLPDFVPSRLFIYYNERKIENTITIDSGASLSDGIKSLNDSGVCPESSWPYQIEKFTEEPSVSLYKMASSHQVLASKRVPISVNGFKTMINMGYPVAFGFTVYESFESQEVANSGIMPMPKKNEQVLGGHAVLCVGYDDTMKSHDGKTTGFLKVRNSWGSQWGKQGYFYMPYDYINQYYMSDLWVITKNEGMMVKMNKELSTDNSSIKEKIMNIFTFSSC